MTTPADIEQEWRKHYLVTGNVAGSARAVGIPVSTGYELRKRALADEVFVESRKAIRASLEPDAEQMAVSAMQLCMERLNKDPDERLRLMIEAGAEKVTFQDPGPQYAASLAKLIQAIGGQRRFEAEREGNLPTAGTVNINVSPTGAAVDRGGSGDKP